MPRDPRAARDFDSEPQKSQKTGHVETKADRVGVTLQSCPDRLRGRYRGLAERAAEGSRSAAIRLTCLGCCGWQSAEVRRCEIRACPLWGFRPGAKEDER